MCELRACQDCSPHAFFFYFFMTSYSTYPVLVCYIITIIIGIITDTQDNNNTFNYGFFNN